MREAAVTVFLGAAGLGVGNVGMVFNKAQTAFLDLRGFRAG